MRSGNAVLFPFFLGEETQQTKPCEQHRLGFWFRNRAHQCAAARQRDLIRGNLVKAPMARSNCSTYGQTD